MAHSNFLLSILKLIMASNKTRYLDDKMAHKISGAPSDKKYESIAAL